MQFDAGDNPKSQSSLYPARPSVAADSAHPTWVRAISKAADVLLSNPYVEVMDNGDALIVSESSGQIYLINGRCEGEVGKPCKGYQFNHGICYHRALKRLATSFPHER